MPDHEHEFIESFRGIHFLFSKLYSRFLTQVDLTLTQYTLLHVIHSRGEISMREASDELNISKPAVTYLADGLERKGYLKRLPHETDRRVHLLQIQSKGKKIVEKAQDLALEFLMKSLSDFNKDQKQVIGKFYEILTKRMDDALQSKGNRDEK